MKKTSKKVIAVTLSASMLLGGSMTAMAATTNPDISQREIDHKTAAKNIAAQGMVLMENKNNSLPISAKKGTKVALFGQGVYNTIKGGTGSGAVNQRDNVTIQQGFENAGYDIVDTDLIDQMQALWKSDGGNTSGGGIWGSTWVNERKYADVEGAMDKVDAAAEQTDTAIYVISRNSGEFRDRTATKGDYFLSEDEEANLAVLGQKFDNVIVVLNVGGIIDTKFFDQTEGLDSMLLMSQAGMTGGDALVEVLNGTVNPSGKLTDTWPVNFDDNPSSATFANNDGNTAQEVYNDDIFVGYRYYDTFGKDVAYEFGYGGSYTKFAMSTQSVTADKDKVTVKVKVKNTGTVSGKEVAEVYFSAPEGNLDKPYQELAGYAKTDELAPGESQVLTITYDTTEMGSYDTDKAAYVMEDGDYIIRVGNSSRNTHVAGKISVAEDTITEQYSNLMVPVTENPNVADDEKYPTLEPMTTEGAVSITYDGEADEIAAASTIAVDFTGYKAPEIIKENEDVDVYVSDTTETQYLKAENKDGATGEISRVEKGNKNSSDYTVTYNEHVKKFDGDFSKNTLADVAIGRISMEQFVSGLTLNELAELVNGHSTDSTVKGVAGSTWRNDAKGFTPVNLSDGPAGLRITQSYKDGDQTYYQYATAWPIGTLLAQTWDTDQIYAYGEGVGEEMEEFGIGCWLAPGMNIHRNALCGRNFEYYSEDPVVVGITGTAATLGVQSNKGVGVTIKHYALNSQETNRNSENNTVSERAIREIYLKGFEAVVKQAQPMAIMTSYNQNNGRPAADDYDLCTAFARDEWGFQGMIMTDWGGGQSVPMYEMHAGNDLVCPGKGASQILKAFISEPDWTKDGYVNMETRYKQVDDGTGNLITVPEEVPNFGGYKLDLNGTMTVSTTVAQNVALNGKIAELVEQGYATVTVGSRNTTVAYKVSRDAEVSSEQVISIGDLQKAAINICNFIMDSTEFAKAHGFTAQSLNDKYANILKTITSHSKDAVQSTLADKGLQKLINTVKDLDSSEYTADSWKALEDAVAAAKDVVAKADAAQAEIDAAVNGIIEALGNLEYGVQKLHLETAIEAAEAILADADNYESVDALKAAADAGKAVLAKADASQSEIDAAADAVLAELSKLVENADRASLKKLADAAEKLTDGNYTSDSIAKLNDAISKAKDALENGDEAAIAGAYEELIDAITNLEMKGNKAALKAMLEKAAVILADTDAYVASTIDGLATVKADAQNVYDNADAVQSEINAAVKSLTLKIAAARLLGDVNGDGAVTTSDSVSVLAASAELTSLDADATASADVNGDGVADTLDATLILQTAAEK